MATSRFPLACLTVAALLFTLSSGSRAVATATDSTSPAAPNSADRMILWTSCGDLIGASDDDLAQWARRGVGGFVCMTGRLAGLGGDQRFTDDPATATGEAYQLQAALLDANLADRLRRHDMAIYLGFYLANLRNGKTPLGEWFDDAAWNERVLPAVRNVAAAAKSMGFTGLAFDDELYAQANGNVTATWVWNYPGNVHTEAVVRAQVRHRGGQLMQAILEEFPSVRILDYGTYFPNTWHDLVQKEVNGIDDASVTSTQIDFWDGLTSVEGYESIQFLNALFYKTFHIDGSSWDNAFTYEYNRFFAMLSRRFSNWSYAADRVSQSPFVWIGAGSTRFEAARPPDYVAEQLAAARRWGMERQFGAYDSFAQQFDYRPYFPGIEAATQPGIVAENAPELSIDQVRQPGPRSALHATLTGRATDELAVRLVRWQTEDGQSGIARLRWVVDGGDPQSGWHWHTAWTADDIPVQSGDNRITIVVENIKGLTTTDTRTIVVR